MSNQSIKDAAEKYLMNTYGDREIALIRGEGCYVYDADGNRYLDFLGGLGVSCLGHQHPAMVRALEGQARKLLHVSNLYLIEPQVELGRLLVENTFADKVFFANSGAEANEGVFKLIRKYAKEKVAPQRTDIIAFEGSFHGRTLATITATGQPKYSKGFEPLMPGFKHVPFNDLDAVSAAIDEHTAGIIVEPIQGEGGINTPAEGFLQGLRDLADQHNLVLAFDEVHTGCGRTGAFMGYQTFGVEPDVISLAKSLGGGLPISAFLTRDELAECLGPGTHATTYGGNPLVTAVSAAVIRTILEDDLPSNAARMGEYFTECMLALKEKHGFIRGVRGRGLILGLELDIEAKAIAGEAIRNGLLTYCISGRILRFHPPLIIEKQHVDEAVSILDQAMGSTG